MKKNHIAAAALFTAGMLALAGCSSGSGDGGESDAPKEDFVVLNIQPLSGPLAVIGRAQADGVKAAAEVINDNGGIDGREVVVVEVDDAWDAAQAVTVFQDYVAENGAPDLVFPGLSSQETLALLPLTTREQVFSVGTSASAEANNPAEFPYYFSSLASSDAVSETLLDWAEEQGAETVGFIAPETATGRGALDSLQAAADERGLELVSEIVDPTSVDVTANLQRLQSSDPDVLIIDAVGGICGVILDGRTKLGWDLPTLADANSSTSNWSTFSSEEDWTNVEILTWAYGVAGSEATQKEAYTDLIDALVTVGVDVDAFPSGFSTYGHTYNAMMYAWAAYEASDSDDPADLQAALENGDQDPAIMARAVSSTDWKFSPENHTVTMAPSDWAIIPAGGWTNGSFTQ